MIVIFLDVATDKNKPVCFINTVSHLSSYIWDLFMTLLTPYFNMEIYGIFTLCFITNCVIHEGHPVLEVFSTNNNNNKNF